MAETGGCRDAITTTTLDQLAGQRFWIYTWDAHPATDTSTYFYALPGPMRVAFDYTAYGHLTLVCRNVPQMSWAVRTILQPCGLLNDACAIRMGREGDGYLVTTECSLADLEKKAYLGTPVFFYVQEEYRRRMLYRLLQHNYKIFGIGAMGPYRDAIHCYFDHERRRLGGCFQSRGLFRVSHGNLVFVKEDEDEWPSFRALAFHLHIIRLGSDEIHPSGNSIDDRLVAATFTDYAFPDSLGPPSIIRTWSIAYYPGVSDRYQAHNQTVIVHPTESKAIAQVLEILRTPGPVFVTAHDLISTFYPFLFKRAAFYGILPKKVPPSVVERCCEDCNSSALIECLTPAWILTVDLDLYRDRFCKDKGGHGEERQTFPKMAQMYRTLENGGILENRSSATKSLEEVLEKLKTTTSKVSSIMRAAIRMTSGLTRLADADPEMCLRPHTRTAVTRHLLESQFQSTYTAPLDPLVGETGDRGHSYPARKYAKAGRATSFKGGLVLRPSIGIHRADDTHAIGCWDFRALYPSLMHGMNLQTGFVTCVSKDVPVDGNEYHVLEVDDLKYISVLDIAPISRLCEMLIKRRFCYEKAGQDDMASGLKLLANSIYGLVACRTTKHFDAILPAMITGYGRRLLDLAQQYAIAKDCTVLAGDTDSLFLRVPANIGLNNLSRDFADHFRDLYPNAYMVNLTLKAGYELLVVCSKKKYAGVVKTAEVTSTQMVGLLRRQSQDRTRDLVEQIMDILMAHPLDYGNRVYDHVHNWFDDAIAASDDVVSTLKAKPAKAYKDHTRIPYILSRQYELCHGCPVPTDGMVLPYYVLVPLVPCRIAVCYVGSYDRRLQTIDRTPSVIDNLKCVERLLRIIDDRCTLENVKERYLQVERSRLLGRHIDVGYIVHDLSNVRTPALTLTFKNGGSAVFQEGQMVGWWDRMVVRQRSSGAHLILRAVLHYDEVAVSSPMWVALPAFREKKSFYTLGDIAELFPPHIRSWIRIAFEGHRVDVNDYRQTKAFLHLLYSVSSRESANPPLANPPLWIILLPRVILRKNNKNANDLIL